MRTRLSVVVIGIACAFMGWHQYASAEEAQLKLCMASVQKELGVSPDIAYKECSKRSISDCIKRMAGAKFVALSVGRKRDLYIVDAGNDYTRWMEGWGWRAKDCEPHGEGPRRDDYYMNFWGTQKRTLFRQGACKSEKLELDQVNSIQEAETLYNSGTITLVDQKKEDDASH